MKQAKHFFMTVILAIVMFFTSFATVGMVKTEKAAALHPDYSSIWGMDCVYYFSDSEPDFADVLETQIGLDVVYDVHYFLTSQELAYMLYSGYFWGFNSDNDRNLVIIEMKATKPDYTVLENLFICLKEQGCKTMFISPFASDFGGSQYLDASLDCNRDEYADYIRYSIKDMLNEDTGILPNNTALFLDGRLIWGRTSLPSDYSVENLCVNYPTLRRLLLYMYYGCNIATEVQFEQTLYQTMWTHYLNYYYNEYDLNYFQGDTDILSYIYMWESIAENDNFNNNLEAFETSVQEAYQEACETYYQEIISALNNKNTLVFLHSDGTQYYEIINYNVFSFSYDSDLSNISNMSYAYGMGQWELPTAVYNFFFDVQTQAGSSMSFLSITQFPVYIWEVEPFVDTGSGLIVTLLDQLREKYGEFEQYDQESLNEEFLSLFLSIL